MSNQGQTKYPDETGIAFCYRGQQKDTLTLTRGHSRDFQKKGELKLGWFLRHLVQYQMQALKYFVLCDLRKKFNRRQSNLLSLVKGQLPHVI